MLTVCNANNIEHFIWVPLVDVPVDGHSPINSLKQPALNIYKLATCGGAQQLLIELATRHEEMGYFVFCDTDSSVKIIGVKDDSEDTDELDSGFAIIFNAQKQSQDSDSQPTSIMLESISSGNNYPNADFIYTPGSIAPFWCMSG